ncbi:OmpA-OmpF porin, OOP family [Mucilaginibacter pineti]|uniref:OmpA-OmpF porin, OOP family n=1 Tax=Mucilaginibacter pineti TaxID=1391627 RepID=A0A1G6T7E7_9SPHI|nr:OmpA family protein [Mucilaginibacter pineti]SDD24486.1 OmpA-OmpF porin, OOP family [Mucilaginibacter pineti]
MKPNLKKITLLLVGLIVGSTLFAQTDSTTAKDYVEPFSGSKMLNTWSLGVGAGIMTGFNFFTTKDQQDFTHPSSSLGYGLYVKKQVLPSLGIQLDAMRGKLNATQSQVDPTGTQPNGLGYYHTSLNWAAALSVNFTFANINWEHDRPFIQPYITLGGGIMNYTPRIFHNDGAGGGVELPFKTEGNHKIFETYIPLGFGFKFTVARNLNLDLGWITNFANTDNLDGYNYGTSSDKFSYIHGGLEFAFGSTKKPQMAVHNPVASMRTEYKTGDTQLQGEINSEKAKNDKLRSDLDATNATLSKLTTDSDGDGVVDANDKCPNTPPNTKVDGAGCPLPLPTVVTEEDKKVIKEAIRNLEFDFSKATIHKESLPSLDKVAQLLVDKNFSLKLAGHTDNVGSDAMNMKLSKARAESVKAYLVSKGANPSRIEATGYGESQPIATNKTAKGRQINRRVEFTLF